MAEHYIISPIDIATQGLLSGNALIITNQGFSVDIGEEIIDVRIDCGGIEEDEIVKRKLITVTFYKDNKEYWQTKQVTDVNVLISDVKIFISRDEENKPVITVKFPNDKT